MHRFWRFRSRMSVVLSLVVLASLAGGFVLFAGAAGSGSQVLAKGLTYASLSPRQRGRLSGLVVSELNASRGAASNSATGRGVFSASGSAGCSGNRGNNIRVNQNCLNITDTDLQGRGQTQTEPSVAEDPLHPGHLVAGLNDYRSGDSNCSSAFSRDGGQSWTEAAVPLNFSRGTSFGGVEREYWQVSGNTAVAWDTRGNAYLTCEAFMRGPGTTNNADLSSAFYVFRSTANGGTSWNFPGHSVVEAFTQDPAVLVNKPAMAVDARVGSPFQDRVYVTWTVFAGDGSMYVEEAHSSDYGQSFSAPTLVSSSSPLCANTLGVGTPQGPCNANEFSAPFTGPDGALYVVYNNFNTDLRDANDNHFQLLLSKSIDGGNSFLPPVLVANYFDLPDCGTYQGGQNAGLNCMPEKGAGQNSIFRSTNFSSGAVNPVDGSVVVAFGSYINRDSNAASGCLPTGFAADGDAIYTGVKTMGACSNQILVSVSTNGGASFNGEITDPTRMTVATPAAAQRLTDQWFPSAAFTRDGRLVVSYYDRQYGQDETSGTLDVSLSSSRDLRHFAVSRITSSSLPLPTQFPSARGNGTFMGDYIGLAAGSEAHPIWTDTRTPDLALCPGTGTSSVPPRVCTFTAVPNGPQANDQEVFTASASVAVP
ncbi:MAG TPA: hypothetical protein VGF67_01670 [Ktedonobacteraceae bacterium]|jgi:hypothetical protein